MRIRIADKDIGECIIESNKDLNKEEEYALKSLCFLQLMCMGNDTGDDRFHDFVRIMKEAIEEIKKVYQENNETGPIDHILSSPGFRT